MCIGRVVEACGLLGPTLIISRLVSGSSEDARELFSDV